MNRRIRLIVASLFLALSTAPAAAASTDAGPPPVCIPYPWC